MNIKSFFGFRKDRAMDQVDKLIVGGLTTAEQKDARREIASQFDELLSTMQDWADDMDKMRSGIERDNDLIRMLCKGGA